MTESNGSSNGNDARPAARPSRSSEPLPPRDSIDENLRKVDEALQEMGETIDEFEKLEGGRGCERGPCR